jgi:hypothetical protein
MGRSEAADSVIHGPLPAPVPIVHAVPPPPPPPPSKLELQDRIRTALAAEFEAKAALDSAQATHERAKALVETSSQALANFESLESEIAAETTANLRQGSGRYSLPCEVKDKLVAREVAKAAFAAADASEQQLADELAAARDRLTVRTKSVDMAVAAILARRADEFAQDILEHRRESERLQGLLLGFDQYIPVNPDALPESVRGIILSMGKRMGTREQASVWRDAAAIVRADPQAEVVIQDPPPPAPRPSVDTRLPHVRAVQEAQAKARAEPAQPETPSAAAE